MIHLPPPAIVQVEPVWVAYIFTRSSLDGADSWWQAGSWSSREAAMKDLEAMQLRAGKPLRYSLGGPKGHDEKGVLE